MRSVVIFPSTCPAHSSSGPHVSRPQEFINKDPSSGSNSPSPDENLATHPSFKNQFNPSAPDESFESYFALQLLASVTPTPPSSPEPAPARTGSAPNSSARESGVGKKQRHNEKLKLAGSDDSSAAPWPRPGTKWERSHLLPRTHQDQAQKPERKLEKKTLKWQNAHLLVSFLLPFWLSRSPPAA